MSFCLYLPLFGFSPVTTYLAAKIRSRHMHACTKTDAEMDREVDTDTVARTNTQITHRPHVPLRRWYIVISWNRRWDFRHVSYIFFQTDWVFSHVRFRLGYEGAMRRLKIFGFSRFFIFSRQHIFSVACNYYFFEGSALGIFGGLVSCLVWRLSLLHGLEAFLWLTADTRVGPTFHLRSSKSWSVLVRSAKHCFILPALFLFRMCFFLFTSWWK